MVSPRIGAGFDGDKPIASFRVGERAAGAGKDWIDRRSMIVPMMSIAAGSIGLPNLDQSVRNGPAIFVENAPGQNDSFAQGIATMLASQIVVCLTDALMSKYRPGYL